MSIDKKQLSKLVYYMATFDGGIYKRNNSCSFIMNMKEENKDYIDWVAEVLSNITTVKVAPRKDYNTDGYNRQPQLRLETRVHPYFYSIYERIYLEGKKVIDPHMLSMMDDEALAIIFMCDGSSNLEKRFKNPHCDISLNTKGFSFGDNLLLSKAIYNKCGIKSNINKHYKYYYIRIKTEDVLNFIYKILPYIKPSFYYKLERIAPAIRFKLNQLRDGDIVCSLWQHKAIGGNDQS